MTENTNPYSKPSKDWINTRSIICSVREARENGKRRNCLHVPPEELPDAPNY